MTEFGDDAAQKALHEHRERMRALRLARARAEMDKLGWHRDRPYRGGIGASHLHCNRGRRGGAIPRSGSPRMPGE